jgi:hypothetical protein
MRVCLQLTWKVGLPPSPVEFSSLCHSHKLSLSWLLGTVPAPSRASLARLRLFIYCSRKDSPPLLFRAEGAPPSLQCIFIVLIAYYSVSVFSPSGDWSVGGYTDLPQGCLWKAYRLAHLVCVFPSHLGTGDWQSGGPPGFSA